jgi:hypothetical protein
MSESTSITRASLLPLLVADKFGYFKDTGITAKFTIFDGATRMVRTARHRATRRRRRIAVGRSTTEVVLDRARAERSRSARDERGLSAPYECN